jgi:hypothetical protein
MVKPYGLVAVKQSSGPRICAGRAGHLIRANSMLVICLDCGFAEFSTPKAELGKLANDAAA